MVMTQNKRGTHCTIKQPITTTNRFPWYQTWRKLTPSPHLHVVLSAPGLTVSPNRPPALSARVYVTAAESVSQHGEGKEEEKSNSIIKRTYFFIPHDGFTKNQTMLSLV